MTTNKIEQLYALLDVTSLNNVDSRTSVLQLLDNIRQNYELSSGKLLPATVCVYPLYIEQCAKYFQKHKLPVKTCTVVGGFPHGQLPIEWKQLTVKMAMEAGAQEIDCVVNRGAFLNDEQNAIYNEVVALKEVAGEAIKLKIIIETGDLKHKKKIETATKAAALAGADFVKSSTGKLVEGATLESVAAMANALKEHQNSTGKLVGLKISGGIVNIDAAWAYFKLVESKMGQNFMHSATFRLGTSRLAGMLAKCWKN